MTACSLGILKPYGRQTMTKRCPDCEADGLPEAMKVCECGHVFEEVEAPVDPSRFRCAWTDGTNRCPLPGTQSNSTRKGGSMFCRDHVDVKDTVLGNQIMDDHLRNRHKLPIHRDWRDEMVGAAMKQYEQRPEESHDEYIERLRAEFLSLSRRGALRRLAPEGEGLSRGED